jgi:hypothetical protein
VSCALGASIEQDQEGGLRYHRAVYKYQTCRVASDRDFCKDHPAITFSDGDAIGQMDQQANARCGTINSIYLAEPARGVVPPFIPSIHKKTPCDGL